MVRSHTSPKKLPSKTTVLISSIASDFQGIHWKQISNLLTFALKLQKNSSATVIRRCSNFLPIHTLKLIFNSTGPPYINYGAPILFNLSKCQLQPIIAKYNEYHCSMLQVKKWTHTSNDQNFSTLSSKPLVIIIINIHTINFPKKIVNHKIPF